MSSNNDSPAEKSAKRSNKTRRNVEYQERVLSQVREMFDSILDPDVILSVVQNCNWKLQPSIEHLITLSANVNSSTENNGNLDSYNEDFVENEQSASADNLNSSQEDDAFEVDTDFTYLNINDEELQKQKDEFKKFELMRKHTQDFSQDKSPSRLPRTSVINESPLETIQDEEIKSTQEDCIKKDFIKNDFPKHIPDESVGQEHTKVNYSENASGENLTYPLFPNDEKDSRNDLLTCNQNQLPTFNPKGSSQEAFKNFRQAPNQVSNFKTEERRKTETESLCGLKVQYRFGGPETSSDDDADVVIEEESSDYSIPIPQNTQTNVCQFLSLSTQSLPKTTRPQTEMISSSSPFSSPGNKHKFKACYISTLNRVKSTIQQGFKIMVIMRGMPGSGKSHLARDIVQSTNNGDPMQYIFCTDDFFVRKGRGVYDFDPMKLSDAHASNQQRVLKAVREGRSPVIVDNTNTQCWEMQPYVVMAVQYGYFIEVLEPDTPWVYNVNELARRNEHGVLKQSIQRMLERFEKNITGAKLLRMFSLKYDPYYTPPQPSFPLISSPKSKRGESHRGSPLDSGNAKKVNRKGNKKNKKLPVAEEKLDDYVPTGFSSARVVDAIPNPYNENLTALQLAMKTFGGDDDGDDDDLSPKENAQDLIQDKWEDDGISWEDEMLKVEIKNKNSDALKETLNEESSSLDNKVRRVCEIPYLNLGAIGSERKNNVVQNTIANNSDKSDSENILSQCWDFTLLLGGRQIHSVGSVIENGIVDEEKGCENISEKSDSAMESDTSSKSGSSTKSDNSEESKGPTEELKEAQNTLDKDSSDCGTKSSNTESFEHIDSNSEELSFEIRVAADTKETIEASTNCLENTGEVEEDSESLNIDPQAKVSFGSIMKFIKKSFLGANNDSCKPKKIEEVVANSLQMSKTSETVMDSLTEKLHSPVKEHSACNLKTLDYEVEFNLESDSNDTLSKKLSVIARGSENANENLVFETQGNFESVESLGNETIIKSNDIDIVDLYSSVRDISSDNECFLSTLEASNINSPEKINLNKNMNLDASLISTLFESEDIEESRAKFIPIKLTGPLARAVLSLEENENLILEEKELIKSETKNSDIKNIETTKSDTTSQYFETIDNINSITWKESPFPTCDMQISIKADESTIVSTSEASTNTSIYDFNVLYVGGTDEPQYKLLNTVNRSINEGLIPNNLETPPPRKLKLDKSSMTNEVDVLLELPTISGEIEELDRELIQGLIDMFPHIPKDYVIDVYTNLCKGDSHWAIDVLLGGVSPEGILNAQPLKPMISENSSLNSSPIRNKRTERLKQSSSSDSNDSESSPQIRKKEKNHVSENTLALKRHLEDKMMISEASYHPHILRVKKWKNREPDVSTEEIIEAQARNKDVIQFVNDLSPTEVATSSPTNSDQSSSKEKEESDGDDSSEPEEMMELNLGWEFITNLEKQFGNPNFLLPDGLFPVIQVKKSVAEEIHALWMESMQQQMDTQQEHLDAMIAKDAEYAKSLEVEEAKALTDSTVPNLNEVMDMELALAVYKNDLKKQTIRETPLDMASRLTRQMLNEMFPDTDPDTLSEILKAHNGNFKDTVEVLEASTGRSFSSTDTLNKQNSLMVKVKQQSLAKEEGVNFKPSSSTSTDLDSSTVDQSTYDHALQTAHESREEAERQFLLRNENFNKAALAYRRGNPAVASYYSEMAKLHSKKMESANSAAASAFLAAQTHALSEDNTLDLHNLFVPEALQALDIFLDHQLEFLNRGTKRSVELFIITGRGARSNNNKSKIKPAISRRLTSRNMSFSEANPGCLKVKLYRHNSASI